jgi:hypothetical protein
MPREPELKSSHSAVHGLATVAMLKVNYDADKDHIAMFEPFVRDAVAALPQDDMDAEEVNAEVLARHELKLPASMTRTLLQRMTRQGFLRREGGRYFRERGIDSEDVLQSRQEAESRQRRLAAALIESAAERDVEIEDDEEALGLIMGFMESYHVTLAVDEPPEVDSSQLEGTRSSPQQLATALFLKETIAAEGELATVLQEVLEGFVLQNTLLLRDISSADRKFQNLEVVLDSQILFGLLGMRGAPTEAVNVEFLKLLKDTGAIAVAFKPTIREMRGILMVYEQRIGSSEGRATLRQSELTTHFLAKGYGPADIRQQAALIEKSLAFMGVVICEPPERTAAFTLDEKLLAEMLSKKSGEEDESRVVHDVDCVAGVLSRRKGRASDSLDTAQAVFVTTSRQTVRHIQSWYSEQRGQGFPPVVDYLALSNYAWLKRPDAAAKLKVYELVALCTAALRPSPATWEHFVQRLRDLEASGQLTSDEVAAVVASELTVKVLVEEGFDEQSDAESISEVVRRVRACDRRVADEKVEMARKAAVERSTEAQNLRKGIRRRAESIAGTVSKFAVGALLLSAISGTVFSLVDAAGNQLPSLPVLLLTFVPLATLGLLSITFGFHLKAWERQIRSWLADRFECWMLPRDNSTLPDEG